MGLEGLLVEFNSRPIFITTCDCMSPVNNPSVPDHVLPSSRYVSQPLRREAQLVKKNQTFIQTHNFLSRQISGDGVQLREEDGQVHRHPRGPAHLRLRRGARRRHPGKITRALRRDLLFHHH